MKNTGYLDKFRIMNVCMDVVQIFFDKLFKNKI